jgi:hypothetical protein
MVGITICIVIRLQESVVACILQPWSGGKDPDRYIVPVRAPPKNFGRSNKQTLPLPPSRSHMFMNYYRIGAVR